MDMILLPFPSVFVLLMVIAEENSIAFFTKADAALAWRPSLLHMVTLSEIIVRRFKLTEFSVPHLYVFPARMKVSVEFMGQIY